MSSSSDEKINIIVAAAIALIALASMRGSNKNGHGSVAAAALQPRRGRFAKNPHEIPARGWKDIAIRVYKSLSQDRLLAEAAGITYYALLAIFPAIAALVSVSAFLPIQVRSRAP